MTCEANRLCRSCGLCCDGTLFQLVELEPGDDAQALRATGLAVLEGPAHFLQPCPHLADGCGIYPARPAPCRKFECATLAALNAGEITAEAASGRVAAVRQALAGLALVQESGDTLIALRDRLSAARAGSGAALPAAIMIRLAGLERVLDRHFRSPEQQSFQPGTAAPDRP